MKSQAESLAKTDKRCKKEKAPVGFLRRGPDWMKWFGRQIQPLRFLYRTLILKAIRFIRQQRQGCNSPCR